MERRENEIAAKEASVRKKEKEVDGLHEKGVQELERISGFTSEEAKEYLLKSVEDEVKIDTAKLYKELESRAKEEMCCRSRIREYHLRGTASER